jgi:N utilization substance protein B
MASRRKGRVLAFQVIYAWDLSGKEPEKSSAGSFHTLLGSTQTSSVSPDLLDFPWLESEKRAALDDATLAFARLLISGTIENIDAVDAMIVKHLKNWEISRLSKVDLAILRMSVYSLLYQKDIAPTIIINEAIGISKDYGGEDSFRFINGVLDSVRKDLEDVEPQTE